MAVKKKIVKKKKKKREDIQLLITVELKDKLVSPKEILFTIKGITIKGGD